MESCLNKHENRPQCRELSFLTLPAEIRYQVYSEYFMSRHGAHTILFYFQSSKEIVEAAMGLAIMQVCRQLYTEVKEILHKLTVRISIASRWQFDSLVANNQKSDLETHRSRNEQTPKPYPSSAGRLSPEQSVRILGNPLQHFSSFVFDISIFGSCGPQSPGRVLKLRRNRAHVTQQMSDLMCILHFNDHIEHLCFNFNSFRPLRMVTWLPPCVREVGTVRFCLDGVDFLEYPEQLPEYYRPKTGFDNCKRWANLGISGLCAVQKHIMESRWDAQGVNEQYRALDPAPRRYFSIQSVVHISNALNIPRSERGGYSLLPLREHKDLPVVKPGDSDDALPCVPCVLFGIDCPRVPKDADLINEVDQGCSDMTTEEVYTKERRVE